MKICNKCGERKPESCFGFDGSTLTGLQYTCKLCKRDIYYKKTYSVSIDDYNIMLENQGGGCAICGKTQNDPLFVDHNHHNNNVRGLLCNRCNSGIGFFENKSIDEIKSILIYLGFNGF